MNTNIRSYIHVHIQTRCTSSRLESEEYTVKVTLKSKSLMARYHNYYLSVILVLQILSCALAISTQTTKQNRS